MQINHSNADVTGEFIRVGRTDLPAIRYHSIKATHSGGAAANKISFNIHNASTTTSQAEVLTILGDGNIGINVVSPSGVLHAYKATGTQRSYFESGDNHSFLRLLGGTSAKNSGIEFYSGSSTNTANITATSTSALQFDVGSTNAAMYINSSGSVGLGTSTPSYKLEVIGGANSLYAVGDSTTAASLSFGAGSSHILRCENSEIAVGLHNASPYNLYLQGRTNAHAARSVSINPLGGDVAIGSIEHENIPLHAKGQTGQTTILKLKSVESTVNQQWMQSGNANMLHQYDGLSFNTYTPSASGSLELQHQINHHGITLTQGKGINFYNYGQGTDITNNKFDDYEVGEWTPVLQAYDFNNSNAWTNVTYDDAIETNYQKGRYTKIGNIVHVWWYSNTFSLDSGYNNLPARIIGLPFYKYNVLPYYSDNFSFPHTTCFKDTAGNFTQPSGGFLSAGEVILNPMIANSIDSCRWGSEANRYIMLAGTYATSL